MSSRYAKDTQVPVANSRAEVERVLIRYGCDAFVSGWSNEGAMVQFGYKGRNVKISVPYPANVAGKKFEQAQRQRWRVLLLLVKAQIEAVECGLVKFEEAFLPWIVLKDGSTVYQYVQPQLPAGTDRPRLKEANR
jgi:hypothetical protein